MYDFFYNELKTLKARTGFNQWEKLNESANAKMDIDSMIAFMIEETDKPPFNLVRPEVKQRVISRAVVEDAEFIGLSAKFVRRALNAWWGIYGDKILQARDEQVNGSGQKVVLTAEQSRKIDEMANKYRAEILENAQMKSVPKIEREEVRRLGAEWKSNLEWKSSNYDNGLTVEQLKTRQRILREASEFYKTRYDFSKFERYQVEGYEILAENESDALTIYERAKK